MIKMLKGSIEDYKNSYINQKAEIERLKTNLNVELENFATEYDNKIKAEAYKECIEKVKEEINKHSYGVLHKIVINYKIDNLLKEKVGMIMPDNVNHPAHYESGQFECIDVMLETQGAEAVKNFCICNAFKYLYRHRRKNGAEDIAKAKWYLDKYLEIEKEQGND